MPRRNRRLDFDHGRDPRSSNRVQRGKGGKRPRDWHRSTCKGYEAVVTADLPDVGSGADPTAGTPTALRQGGRNRWRGAAMT